MAAIHGFHRNMAFTFPMALRGLFRRERRSLGPLPRCLRWRSDYLGGAGALVDRIVSHLARTGAPDLFDLQQQAGQRAPPLA